MNLEILRGDLRSHLGMDTLDLDDAAASRLLNRAYWELLDKFPFRDKETYSTLPVVIGTASYTIDFAAIEAISKITIEDPETLKHKPLDKMSLDVYQQNFVNDESAYGRPTNYVRYGNEIILYPTPDVAYVVDYYYAAQLSDLALESDSPSAPRNWHEIILLGAVYRGFLQLQDYERANAARTHWMTLLSSVSMNEAEENKDTPRAGLRIAYSQYDTEEG